MRYVRRTTRLVQQCFFLGLLTAGLFLAAPAPTLAAPGDLDPTFGSGGKVTTELTFAEAFAFDVALQADGKIVVVGSDHGNGFADFAVVRYHTNGSLDTAFGNGGKASFSFGPFNIAYAVVIQPDGKIVVAGYTGTGGPDNDFVVARYETNGSLDASFDGDGSVIIDMGRNDVAIALALQPDGKIVVAGTRKMCAAGTGCDGDFSVARLNPNGSLDASFGGDGKVTDSLDSFFGGATSVALQPDGKIVVAGTIVKTQSTELALVRYLADGSLDASFDGDGKVIAGSPSGANDVAILPDGKIIAVGFTSGGNVVIRYNADGSLDTSFNGNGISAPVGVSLSRGAVQPNGKIIVGGFISNGNSSLFGLARYNPNGSLDASFGGGIVSTGFDNRGNPFVLGGVNGIAVQPDGRIVAAGGWGADGEFSVFALARYLGDDVPANLIDDSHFFVRQHYLDFLGREPDAAGLQFWANNIEGCGADAQCRRAKREDTSAAFFLSIEFQETGYLAYRAHKAAFGDLPGKPVPLTRSTMLADSSRLGSGVQVGVGDWAARLEANKAAYFDQFVASQEFAARYPSALSPAQFVDALNQNAGGALSPPERDALIADLASGARTRAQALRHIAEDPDFRAAETRRAFVLLQYFGYLRRNPDDPGFDGGPDPTFEGFNFWLTKLNSFGGDFRRAEMVKAFIESIEYRRRFGNP